MKCIEAGCDEEGNHKIRTLDGNIIWVCDKHLKGWPSCEEIPPLTKRIQNKKVVIATVLIAIVAVGVIPAYFFLLRPSEPSQQELDFTISGESPRVCYIPFRTGANEEWNLTIECLEMPSEHAWVMILLYEEYWDKGAGHKCDVDDLYPLATDLTELQELREETVYRGNFGTSRAQSFTVFFSFPSDGIGKFHVKLEKVES